MLAWLVKLEEDLPLDKNPYNHRMTMLAESLIKNNHNVVRWASALNHTTSEIRSSKTKTFEISEKYKITLIKCIFRYYKKGSFLRILHIYLSSFLMFYKFLRTRKLDRPDIIVCSMPSPITCLVCAIYSKIFRIKLIIDSRDMWPVILKDEAKGLKKFFIYPIYFLMLIELKISMRIASALYGITDEFVEYSLSFTSRQRTKFDRAFFLGFSKLNNISIKEEHSKKFWNDLNIFFTDTKIIYFAGEISKSCFDAMHDVKHAMLEALSSKLNIQLVICGGGSKLEELRHVMSGLNNVHVVGRVSPQYLKMLKKNSFLALLSIGNRIDYESSLSNKFFDYMSGGLPILTNLNGVPKRFVTKNNIGFHYSDGKELYTLLSKLSWQPETVYEMSQNAINLYNSKYTSDSIYNEYTISIEELLNEYDK